MSESDRQDELARILCERAQANARHGLFSDAEQTLASLEQMADQVPSVSVQHAFHEAKGVVLVYEGKYDEAIPVLAQDQDNVFSLFRLAYAAQKSGKAQLAKERLGEVAQYHQPTPEQAFINSLSRRDMAGENLADDKR